MIGEKIKELRQAAGMSAEQIAGFLHVSPATVYRYENGDISKMPAKFIKPLAEYLHTTPADLMGWDDAPPGYTFSDDEMRLIAAYRSASKEIKKAALNMLENSAAEQKEKEPAPSSAQTA